MKGRQRQTLGVSLTGCTGRLCERLPGPGARGTLQVADNGALVFVLRQRPVTFRKGMPGVPRRESVVVAHHDLGTLSGSLGYVGSWWNAMVACTLEVGLTGGPDEGAVFRSLGRENELGGSDRYALVCEVFAFARHLTERRAEMGLPLVELSGITNRSSLLDWWFT